MRGNVGTRLAKLDAGEVDATLLAVAGLTRLGLDVAHHPLDPEEMLPASSQGAIGIEIRMADKRAQALCAAINCARTMAAVTAERAFLEVLDGSCKTAIGALATIDGDKIAFDGLIAKSRRTVPDTPATSGACGGRPVDWNRGRSGGSGADEPPISDRRRIVVWLARGR